MMFEHLFHHAVLVRLGIVLDQPQEEALLDTLFYLLQARLRRKVDDRLGHAIVEQLQNHPRLLQALLPDWRRLLHTECVRLFKDIEAHAEEVQRGKWEAVA